MLHAELIPAQDGCSAPCLVWLHGFLGSREEWRALAGGFPGCAHLLVDLPGHGRSAAVNAESFSHVDALLRATLEHFGIGRYCLVGYSLGGRIAMYHAAAAAPPAGLAGLAIEGGNPGLEDESERHARREQDARWARRFGREPLSEVLRAWYQQPVFADLSATERQALTALRADNDGVALARMLMVTSLGNQPFLAPALQALSLPFVYLCGERDDKFRQLAGRYRFPLQLIAGTGHNAHRTNPAAFAARLQTFLSTLSAFAGRVPL